MAAASSKKAKKKGKTLNLTDFLSTGPSSSGVNDGKAIVTVPTYNWADTMDEEDEYRSGTPAEQITLPTAPRSAREEVDLNKVPDRPPFTAHVGNLSYDVDESVLRDIFEKMTVTQVRLQMEMGRSKGYGYVEFADKQSLIDALGLNGETFCNRKIRVDVATQSGNDRSGRYGDRDGRQGGSQISGEGDADDDWRGSAATNRNAQSSYGQRDDGYGARRGYDDRDGGSRRGGYEDREGNFGGGRRGYGDREGGFGGRRGYDERDAGFGGRRGYGDRDGNRNSAESEGSWSRGPARSTYDDQSGPRSRGGYDSSDYGPRRGYDDGPRRDGYPDRDYTQRGGAPPRDYERSEAAPRERPKLQLAPRTRAVENGEGKEKTSAAPSVFGNAKPVDTSAREREIEERLRREQQSQQASGRDGGGPRRGDGSSFASRDIRTNVERRVDNHANDEVSSSSTSANAEKTGNENGTIVEPVRKPSGASAASVFGAAKPVDTSAREREIEERLQKSSLSSASDGPGETVDPMLSPNSDYSKGYGSSTTRSAWNKGPPPSSQNTPGVPSSRSGPPSRPHHRKERKLPQSIDEMPVYTESSAKDFSDGNIYAGLLGGEGDDDQQD